MDSSDSIRKPRVDDKRLQDLTLGMWGYPTALAAYQLGLFRALDGKPSTVRETALALGTMATATPPCRSSQKAEIGAWWDWAATS